MLIEFPTELDIYVSQLDIDTGCKSKNDNCPIAKAVRRIVDCTDISVYPTAENEAGGLRIEGIMFNLPREAVEFIMKFDDGEKVFPFRFKAKKV